MGLFLGEERVEVVAGDLAELIESGVKPPHSKKSGGLSTAAFGESLPTKVSCI